MSYRIAVHTRSWLVVAGCAATAAAFVSHRPQPERSPNSGPRLIFHQQEIDLKEIAVGERVRKVVFPFENRGTSTLHLKEIRSGCGCAGATASRSTVPAGERGEIVVRVHPSQPEERTVAIDVFSDDPIQNQVRLKLHWRAALSLELDALFVDFGKVEPRTSITRILKVVRRDHILPVNIIEIDASPKESLSAQHVPRSDGAGTAESISLTLQSSDEIGRHDGNIAVRFNGTWKNSIDVPVRWEINDHLSVIPRHVFCGFEKSGHVMEKIIKIRADSREAELAVASIDISSDSAGITASVDEISSHECEVRVKIRFPDAEGAFRNQLVIPLTSPRHCELVIPCSGVVTGESASRRPIEK